METASKYAPGTILERADHKTTYLKLEDKDDKPQWLATYSQPSNRTEAYTRILDFHLEHYPEYLEVRVVRAVVKLKPKYAPGTVIADAKGFTVMVKQPDKTWARFYDGKRATPDLSDGIEGSIPSIFHVVDTTDPWKPAA